MTVKGLTTPYRVGCAELFVFEGTRDSRIASYWIDTLVLKIEGNTYATLLHHPLFFEEIQRSAQEVAFTGLIRSAAMASPFSDPPWRSAKLHNSDGAASSSGEEVIRHSFLRWLLSWCRRQVMGVGVKLRDVLLSFQFYHVGHYMTCILIFTI